MSQVKGNATEMGLLSETEQPVLEFMLWKNLPYAKRMRFVYGLIGAGFLLQIGFLSFVHGAPLLLAALLLSWVVGFDNKVDFHHMDLDTQWDSVDIEKLAQIRSMDQKIDKWDTSAWDISNPKGIGVFLVLSILIVSVWIVLEIFWNGIGHIVAGNAFFLLGMQFLSGMRKVHREPDLVFKVDHMLDVLREYRRGHTFKGELGAQLLLRKGEENSLPTQAKVTIRYPDAPQGFHGIQMQVVINRVNGAPHAYCYSVVVAEEGSGLIAKTASLRLPDGIVRETQKRKGVEVVIIRQRTSRTSGYETKPRVSAAILGLAIETAELYLRSA